MFNLFVLEVSQCSKSSTLATGVIWACEGSNLNYGGDRQGWGQTDEANGERNWRRVQESWPEKYCTEWLPVLEDKLRHIKIVRSLSEQKISSDGVAPSQKWSGEFHQQELPERLSL